MMGPGVDVFRFQDRGTAKAAWKKSAAICAGKAHVYACTYMFGMPKKTLDR